MSTKLVRILSEKEYKELLEEGKVLLYTRKGIFQARVYRGDRHYIFRSLKTRKLEDARRLARSLFYEIEIIREKGAPIKSKSIRDVIKEYIEFRELDYKHGNLSRINDANQQKTSIHLLRQIKRASWFWLEYCGNKEVEKIDNSTLKNYASWRRDYYHKIPEVKRPKNIRTNPANKTLEWEFKYAKTVLKFAKERGYLGNKSVPNFKYKANRRLV